MNSTDKLWLWWEDNKGSLVVLLGWYLLVGVILWTFQIDTLLKWLLATVGVILFVIAPAIWFAGSIMLAIADLTKGWRT